MHLPLSAPTAPVQATWYLADAEGEGVLAEPAPARLRSVHSKLASVITFRNTSVRAVRALWVDFDGNEVRSVGRLCVLGARQHGAIISI
jgi:hypothetical protein